MWEQNKGKLHQYVGCKWGKGNCYPKLTKKTNDIQPGRLPFTRNSILKENKTNGKQRIQDKQTEIRRDLQ